MADRAIRRSLAAVFAAVLVMVPSALAAAGSDGSITPTATTQPAPTTTPTTVVSTVPAETTVPDDGGLVGVDSTGSRDSTTITWIGIVAAVALIGIAAWWMLRRDDHDDYPSHPGDDWPTDTEVI